MTMAPRADEEAIELSFGGLAKLRDELQARLIKQALMSRCLIFLWV